MRRLSLIVPILAASALPSFAQEKNLVKYAGLEVKQTLHTGTGYRVSTIFLKLSNPNARAVEVRNIRCEFYNTDKLVKQFTIPRLMVRPGEDKYEAPVTVEGDFNRPVCKLGK